MTALVEQFWKDGLAVIPKLFTPAQVLKWRRTALSNRPSTDLLSDDVLREIVLDPSLLSIARDILGDQPVYFGDSAAVIGSRERNPNFHKDNSDRYDGNAPDWSVDRYPIIRFGIYAQEHGRKPGGLDVRIGSHLHPDITSGKHVSPHTDVGDVVVWNGRTTHSASSRIVRGVHYRVPPNSRPARLFARMPWLLMEHQEERVALFVTYARAHPLLDRHIAYLKTRTYAVEAARASKWSAETIALASERGLALIPPEERLTGIGQTNDLYRQLAY